jgi:hypothetical protein
VVPRPIPTPFLPDLAGPATAGRWLDISLPENQRKVEVVEPLAEVADDAGLSLIELAIASVVSHPAVTSATSGPRTIEQLVCLDDATLDDHDQIARSGVNLTRPTPATASRCSSPHCGGAKPG